MNTMYILYNCSAISPALPRQDACIDCLAWISVPWQQASPTERQCKCQNKMQCWSALTLDDVENAGQHLIHSFCAGQRFNCCHSDLFSPLCAAGGLMSSSPPTPLSIFIFLSHRHLFTAWPLAGQAQRALLCFGSSSASLSGFVEAL